MRVPLSWVRDYVDLAASVDDIAERLTLAGVEVEAIDKLGALSPRVVVGVVVDATPLPNTKLTKLTLDVGEVAPVIALSGAPNVVGLEHGACLAVALPGAQIFEPGTSRTYEVAAKTMQGVASSCVGVSEAELGISDAHEGVVLLDKGMPGAPLASVITPSTRWNADEILTLAILPNIARCQSILGAAYEIAALGGGRRRTTTLAEWTEKPTATIAVSIDGQDFCSGFDALRIEGLTVRESPKWVQRRLILSGLEPINNIVDATNYVLLELGQPTHAYDATLVPEGLATRRSREGELLRMLSQAAEDAPTVLPAGLPIIVSGDSPVGIAGVMGGRDRSVQPTTTSIVLECATFEMIAVRRAQRTMKLFTQASARYSRGVEPERRPMAIARILEILRETCPTLTVTASGHAAVPLAPPRVIVLDAAWTNGSLGTSFTVDEMTTALVRIGLDATREGEKVRVRIPPMRGDLVEAHDLLEELARAVGFDKLPETMPLEPLPPYSGEPRRVRRERLRDLMVRLGLQEAMTYSLSSVEMHRALHAGRASTPDETFVTVKNPIAADKVALRRSLLPGLLQVAAHNLKHDPHVRIFELGIVVHPEAAEKGSKLPAEPYRVAFVASGPAVAPRLKEAAPGADVFDALGLASSVLEHFHLPEVVALAADHAPYQPGSCAQLTSKGRVIGHVGTVHPLVLRAFDIEAPVVAGELDVEALLDLLTDPVKFKDFPRQPSSMLDIALVVADGVTARDIEQVVRASGGELLRSAQVFDVYRGPQVPAGHASIAVRFELNAGERTLTMEEGREIRDRIARALETKVGAKVRE